MKGYLDQKKVEMISFIETLVNIDSGSYLKNGIDQIGKILKENYEEMDFQVEIIKQEEYGNHLVVRHKDAMKPTIMIVAHMDTVFPEGTSKERPFKIVGDRAYGPGVIDMKSSQVSLIYALQALREHGSNAYKNVEIIINSDEEVGSPTSRELIKDRAKDKKYALIMEPARKDGSVVSSRRGNGHYTLNVRGKAAHSGIEPEKGRSAIEELAHKVIQLHELSDHEKGISVNVGMIEGGSSVNTVSDNATAHVDIRITEQKQAKVLEEKIEEICSTSEVDGTKIDIEGSMNRPPMEKNSQTKSLLEIIKEVGRDIGIEIVDTATGGGSDASFTAAAGVATIDGLGPIGGNAHREDEYLEIPSLVERTLLLAKTIERLSLHSNDE
ncbi:M20 family metallopeptidase [Bacillus timonensis]|nr:M20 family metallopeptidase [Bacillus timonensis]